MSASLKIKDSNGRWVEVPEIHGESAYEGAVRNGYTGSESDFYYMLSNFSNAASLANTAAARAEAVLSSLPADYTDIWEVIAVDYQHLVLPIKVGTYCTYDGGVYECNTEITVAESFTAAHWTSRVIGNELSDLKSAITTLGENTSEFLPLTFLLQTGYFGTNGKYHASSSWYSYVYQKSQADVFKLDGTVFSDIAPMILLFNGVPSQSTFIESINPRSFSGSGSATTSNEIVPIPSTAQYIVVNDSSKTGNVEGYLYGNLTKNMPLVLSTISEFNLLGVTENAGFYDRTGAYTAHNIWKSYMFSCDALNVIKINGTQFNNAAPMILFFDDTPSTSSCIGFIYPDGYTGTDITQTEDEIIQIPETAQYAIVNDYSGVGKIYGYSYGNLIKGLKDKATLYTVTKTSNEITIHTSIGIIYVFKKLAANYLWTLCEWSIGGHTLTHSTDMIGPYNSLNAVNNANGDRTNQKPWTGGCHGYDGGLTGSPTAEVVSATLVIDGVEITENGIYTCDALEFVTVNRIQANNTCLANGGGRNVIEEKTTYCIRGNKIKVSNVITALEDVTIKSYYGLQLALYNNFHLLSDNIEDVSNVNEYDVSYVPDMIIGYDEHTQVGMRIDRIGLGTFTNNSETYKAIVTAKKAYYWTINKPSSPLLWEAGTKTYFSGEYIFSHAGELEC